MKRVVPIVEGYGDNAAVPHLIAKIAQHIGEQIISVTPIRAGEWKKLSRPGELERALELALGRNCNQILILLDLDDGCALKESLEANERINNWKGGREIDISLVFITKEYESLFLSCAEKFTDDQIAAEQAVQIAEQIRDAKGYVKRLTKRRYKETQHQAEYTKSLDIKLLYKRSRCFKKLVKELSGRTYSRLSEVA